MPRALSQNPATVERRNRRMIADIDRQEKEWHREVGAYMKKHGVDFETAFVACGGTIVDLTPSCDPEDQDWPD